MNAFATAMLLAAALMLFLAVSRNRTVITVCVVIAAILPLGMLLLTLNPDAKSFGDVRVRMTSVQLADAELVRAPFTLGGDVTRDDIVVPSLPASLARISAGGMLRSDPTRPNSLPPGDPDWSDAGIVSVTRDGRESFLGAYPLHSGDRLCLDGCSSAGAAWFELADGGRRLQRIGMANEELPLIPDRFWFHYKPGQAIFPLRDYARAAGIRGSLDEDVCGARFACSGTPARPVRSFLFHDGGSALYVALLDKDAVIETHDAAGNVSRIDARRIAPVALLDPAQRVKEITLWQVNYADATVDFTKDPRASGLARRRVLKPAATANGMQLNFASSPIKVIGMDDVAAIKTRLTEIGLQSPVAVTFAPAKDDGAPDAAGSLLSLDYVGGRLGAAIAPEGGTPASLIFGDAFTGERRSDSALPVVNGAIESRSPASATGDFSIGARNDAGPTRAISLSVDRFAYPPLLSLMTSGWTLLFVFLQIAAWRDRPAAAIIGLGLQLMLMLRVFVALGSAALDPQIDYMATLADAQLAYFAIPYLCAALFPRPGIRAIQYWPSGLALIASALLLKFTARADAFYVLSGIACASVGMTRGLWPLFGRAGRAALSFGTVTRIRRGVARALRSMPPFARIVIPAAALPWLRLSFGLAAARIALLILLGARERLTIGQSVIALSVVYVPLMLLACAGLLLAIRRSEDRREVVWLSLWFLFAAGLMVVLVPWVVADRGFMLCFLPPVLCVALAFRPAALGRVRQSWLITVPACLIFVSALVSVSYSVYATQSSKSARFEPPANPSKADTIAALTSFSSYTQNYWRVLTVYSPGTLSVAGTTQAERERRWRFLLGRFTGSESGRGLGYRADVADLRPVQSDDNVSAIHLMAPFGRIGAAAFLLMAGVMAWGALRASAAPWGLARATAMLALWTLFAVDTYMVLANLVLVPFTGRNVYLMAAHSRSDLLEATALFAMGFFGLARFQSGGGIDGD